MNTPSETTLIQTLRVMTLAMVTGPLMFLGIVAFISFGGTPETDPVLPNMDLLLTLTLGACIGLNLITKPLVDQIRKAATEPDKLPTAYQTTHIIRLALAEGPAMFGAVCLFLFAPKLPVMDHPKLALFLIPTLTLLVTAALHFPTQDKLDDFKTGGVR